MAQFQKLSFRSLAVKGPFLSFLRGHQQWPDDVPDNKKPIGRNEDVLYTVLLSPTPHTAFIIYLVLKDPTTLTDAIGSHFCRGSRFIFERKKKNLVFNTIFGRIPKAIGRPISQPIVHVSCNEDFKKGNETTCTRAQYTHALNNK